MGNQDLGAHLSKTEFPYKVFLTVSHIVAYEPSDGIERHTESRYLSRYPLKTRNCSKTKQRTTSYYF